MSDTGSEDCLENLQDPASDIDQLQIRQWTSFLQILQNRQREESHRWPHECLLTGMLSLTLSRSKANVASDATWIVLCDVPGLHLALKDNIASKIWEKGPHEICRVRWSSRDPCWCPWQYSREGRFKQQPWMQKLNNSRKNECHGELEISHKWLRYVVL